MVFSSVLNSQIEELGEFVRAKARLEALIIGSGIPYTICHEATKFDDFILPSTIMGERDILPIMCRSTTKFSYISRRDVQHAHANILAGREHHFFAQYQLVGTPVGLSAVEIRDVINRILGLEMKLRRFYAPDRLNKRWSFEVPYAFNAVKIYEDQQKRMDAMGRLDPFEPQQPYYDNEIGARDWSHELGAFLPLQTRLGPGAPEDQAGWRQYDRDRIAAWPGITAFEARKGASDRTRAHRREAEIRERLENKCHKQSQMLGGEDASTTQCDFDFEKGGSSGLAQSVRQMSDRATGGKDNRARSLHRLGGRRTSRFHEHLEDEIASTTEIDIFVQADGERTRRQVFPPDEQSQMSDGQNASADSNGDTMGNGRFDVVTEDGSRAPFARMDRSHMASPELEGIEAARREEAAGEDLARWRTAWQTGYLPPRNRALAHLSQQPSVSRTTGQGSHGRATSSLDDLDLPTYPSRPNSTSERRLETPAPVRRVRGQLAADMNLPRASLSSPLGQDRRPRASARDAHDLSNRRVPAPIYRVRAGDASRILRERNGDFSNTPRFLDIPESLEEQGLLTRLYDAPYYASPTTTLPLTRNLVVGDTYTGADPVLTPDNTPADPSPAAVSPVRTVDATVSGSRATPGIISPRSSLTSESGQPLERRQPAASGVHRIDENAWTFTGGRWGLGEGPESTSVRSREASRHDSLAFNPRNDSITTAETSSPTPLSERAAGKRAAREAKDAGEEAEAGVPETFARADREGQYTFGQHGGWSWWSELPKMSRIEAQELYTLDRLGSVGNSRTFCWLTYRQPENLEMFLRRRYRELMTPDVPQTGSQPIVVDDILLEN